MAQLRVIGIKVDYDPFGDELRDGPRWSVTLIFERRPGDRPETRVFAALTEREYHELVSDDWEWLGGDPDVL